MPCECSDCTGENERCRQTEMLARFRNELRSILREADKAESAIKAVKEKLLAKYPELTKMETKICSMLKLRLTSADISVLFCLSERTIETYRLNIRKKLGLERRDDIHAVLDTLEKIRSPLWHGEL